MTGFESSGNPGRSSLPMKSDSAL